VFVLPAYREGRPLVLLGAKANKMPIVSFDIDTGPREMVDDGINGFLIEPYDTDKMAQKLSLLSEDRQLLQSFSEQSKRKIERFSKPEIFGQWCGLIDGLSAKKKTKKTDNCLSEDK